MGCSSSNQVQPDASGDASTPGEDAGGLERDAGPLCARPIEVTPPADEPSVASASFALTGPPDVWIVDRGMNCQPFAIFGDAEQVRLAGDRNAGRCEGPEPSPSIVHAAPADGLTFSWDGRTLVSFVTGCINCAGRGGSGGAEEIGYAAQPAGSGTYRAGFTVLHTIPEDCTLDPDGGLTCRDTGFGTGGGGDGLRRCPGREVGVEFDLPATGIIDVPVDVPATPPAP